MQSVKQNVQTARNVLARLWFVSCDRVGLMCKKAVAGDSETTQPTKPDL